MQSIDIAVFHFINQTLANPVFDGLMPWLSGNVFFVPLVLVMAGVLIWQGGRRGRLCVLFLLLSLAVGDPLICNSLKKAIGRPRPFKVLADTQVRVGLGDSPSMPSAHAANWAAATMIAGFFYRRSRTGLVALTVLVAVSRVYVGVHYPSDVLAGMILGAGYAACILWGLNAVWKTGGQKWFPLWWAQLPSLLHPEQGTVSSAWVGDGSPQPAASLALESHWRRLAYLMIGLLLFARLAYLASGKIELSEDEAYQWLWSKHLALSYYSKPPLIAYTQFLGTTLWGDHAFGVRFFSPVMAALLALLLFRFLAREVNLRAAFWLVFILSAVPLMEVGATLMTIDPLSVLFWTAAMISGWRAIQQDSTRSWMWTGVWLGLGFLSKDIALFQWLCLAIFFILWPPARSQIKRPGPYLAMLINALCALPVIIWNQQHDWITVTHLANRSGLDRSWQPTLRFVLDFTVAEFFLLNPVFFVAMVWAAVAFWRGGGSGPLPRYLFSMGAPLFVSYWLYSLRARVQPNWIAPSVLPLLCLMVVFWESRWPRLARVLKPWLIVGCSLGLGVGVLLHDTNLVGKLAGRPLPPKMDPLRRVRGWKQAADVIETARQHLAAEGQPAFIIGDHYGITGLLSFYLPEAKAGVPDRPLVFYPSSDQPRNQFYFWPGYRDRQGHHAIYVQQTDSPQPAPEGIQKEFATVTDLGLREIRYRDRVFHTLQLFECRGLR